MHASATDASLSPCYELRFRSLCDGTHDYCFPCDALGRVDLDTLSERARNNYFYARVVIGRELAAPQVHSLPAAATSNAAHPAQVAREAGRDRRGAATA
ncbi:MAG: hypothetical protein WA210_19545 [Burkholderiaceae bacterium]